MELKNQKSKLSAVRVVHFELAPHARSLRPRCRMMQVSVKTNLPPIGHAWSVSAFILN
jgi:hypothetical protein